VSLPRLLIGPANYAGQATELARALAREGLAEARSAEVRLPRRRYNFPADVVLPALRWALDPVWRRAWRHSVREHSSAVVVDGGLPLTRGGLAWSEAGRVSLSRRALGRDLHDLQTRLPVGVLLHGSEIRDPQDHADRHPGSVFRTMPAAQREVLSANVRSTKAALRDFSGPVLVTTPDLLDDWPQALWTPVVRAGQEPEPRAPRFDRPRILAAPTDPALSGIGAYEPVLRRLHDEGLVTYVPVSGLSAAQVAEAVRDSDIVMCKYGLGMYGALGVEGMRAGRLTLADVAPAVRSHIEQEFGELPVVSYSTETLEALVRGFVEHPDEAARLAALGPDFASRVHGGGESARRLFDSLFPSGPG
jgi:hypothetical protein